MEIGSASSASASSASGVAELVSGIGALLADTFFVCRGRRCSPNWRDKKVTFFLSSLNSRNGRAYVFFTLCWVTYVEGRLAVSLFPFHLSCIGKTIPVLWWWLNSFLSEVAGHLVLVCTGRPPSPPTLLLGRIVRAEGSVRPLCLPGTV